MVSNAKHFSKCQYIDLHEEFDKNLLKVTAAQDRLFWTEVGKPVAIGMKKDPYVSKYGIERRKFGRICAEQAKKLGVIVATPGQTVRAKVANIISRGDPTTKAGKKKPALIKSKNQVGWLDLEKKKQPVDSNLDLFQ